MNRASLPDRLPALDLERSGAPRRRLQRKCDCGTHSAGGGSCARCASQAAGLQRKLAIGASNDPLELEADRVADQAMAASSMRGSSPAPVLRLKRDGLRPSPEAPASVEQTLASPGQPLDAPVRADMEKRLGHDFSAVRVHHDRPAQLSAAEIGARAYTAGNHIAFAAGQYAPGSSGGARLLAHELAHVVQQGPEPARLVRRTTSDDIKKLLSYDWNDWAVTDAEATKALDLLKTLPLAEQGAVLSAESGLYRSRLQSNLPANRMAELDRILDNIAKVPGLEAQKTALEAVTSPGSGKSFGEVAGSLAHLKAIAHELAVRKTGTGLYVGTHCAVKPPGVEQTDCTNIVLEVLRETFAQQGRSADWDKVVRKYKKNTKARGATTLSGIDVQAALQSEAGWKGIFWAPDPSYQIPKAELSGGGIEPGEASYAATIASKKGTYYKDFGKKGYPGVSVSQSVTNYAPEVPREPRKAGYPGPSTTAKDTTQLDKLKKLPFGVLSAHGGFHMTLIIKGKVLEVHWSEPADSISLFEETSLENWAVGPGSGYHYYASGVIVAPAGDVDAAFR